MRHSGRRKRCISFNNFRALELKLCTTLCRQQIVYAPNKNDRKRRPTWRRIVHKTSVWKGARKNVFFPSGHLLTSLRPGTKTSVHLSYRGTTCARTPAVATMCELYKDVCCVKKHRNILMWQGKVGFPHSHLLLLKLFKKSKNVTPTVCSVNRWQAMPSRVPQIKMWRRHGKSSWLPVWHFWASLLFVPHEDLEHSWWLKELLYAFSDHKMLR